MGGSAGGPALSACGRSGLLAEESCPADAFVCRTAFWSKSRSIHILTLDTVCSVLEYELLFAAHGLRWCSDS